MQLSGREDINKIIYLLKRRYPKGRRPWSKRSDPFRTLISTILSAQTTDDQVDRVTPALFKRYPCSAKLSAAKRADVERIIRSVGLFKAKAKNIIAASAMLTEKFGGKVPKTLDELVQLPGVGRKTANVVLIKAFGIPAMPVDTHVFRVATRIGLAIEARQARQADNLTAKLTPERVEEQLVKIIPRAKLGAAHFWLIHHGRTLCNARAPQCQKCPLAPLCKYARAHQE